MWTRVVLATAWLAAGLSGCAAGPRELARPSLWEQSRTRAIRVIPSGDAVRVDWSTNSVSRDPGVAASAAPDWQRAIAAAVVASGSLRPHVRFELAEARRATRDLDLTLPGAPPPWTKAYAVGVESAGWLGSNVSERPIFLTVSVLARELPWASAPEGPMSLVRARIVDPTPHTQAEWLADGGAQLRAGLNRLLAAGADRLVADLTEVVGAISERRGRWCGLVPTDELLLRQFDGGPTVLRWKPFDALRETPDLVSVTYEVRVWRIDEDGTSLVVDLAGLPEPGTLVTLAPGYEHSFSARARAALPGGRSWTTPWSVWAGPGDECGPPLEPHAALGRLVAGMPAEVLDPDPPAEVVHPSLLTDAGWVRLVVAAGKPRSKVPADEQGPDGATSREALGALGGLVGSVGRCFLLAPVCAAFTVPLGAAHGAESARRSAQREDAARAMIRWDLVRLRWGLATAARDRAIRQALVEGLRPAQEPDPSPAPGAPQPADGATLELKWLAVSLVGDATQGSATTMEVELVATLRRDGTEPVHRTVVVTGPGPLPASAWLQDNRALLKAAVRTQLLRAARKLMESFRAGILVNEGPSTTSPASPARSRHPPSPA